MNGNKTIVLGAFFLMGVFVLSMSVVSAVDDIDWNVITTGGGNSSNITTQIFPFNWTSPNTFVGIGTNNPIYPLHVVGNSYLGNLQLSGSFNSDLYLPTNKIKIGDSASVNKLDVFGGGMTVSSNSLYSRNSAGSGILLVENKVGVGTTFPTHNLNVFGNTNLSGNVYLGNGSMYVSTTKVGIGTTSPGYTLEVNGTTKLGDLAFTGTNSTTDAISSNGQFELNAPNNLLLDIGTSVLYVRGTSDSARLTIDGSTGNVNVLVGNLTVDTDTLFVDSNNNRMGIGTTLPNTLLDVNGIIRTRATSKGTCDSNAAGAIAYEVFNSTGNFYGCRQTNSTSYSWAQLN